MFTLGSVASANSYKSVEVAVTQSNAAELMIAVAVYKSAYSEYPPLDRKSLYEALKGGKNDQLNPKGLRFWSPKTEKKFLWWTTQRGMMNENGDLIDGWGQPFHWDLSDDQKKLKLISKGKNGVLDAEHPDGDDLHFIIAEPHKTEVEPVR